MTQHQFFSPHGLTEPLGALGLQAGDPLVDIKPRSMSAGENGLIPLWPYESLAQSPVWSESQNHASRIKAEIRSYFWLGLYLTNLRLPGF